MNNNDLKTPIPSHLKSNIKICVDEKNNENNFVAELFCECSSNLFQIEYVGKLKKSLFGSYSVYPTEDNDFRVALKTVCNDCGKSIIVFDSKLHGYDALIERKENQQLIPVAVFNKFSCSKCAHKAFTIGLKITSPGKAEYEDLYKDGIFKDGDWADAFDWITISPTCDKCKKTNNKFIDFETA